jgi:hypothetical protein
MNKYLKEFEDHLNQFEDDNWDDFDMSASDDEEPGFKQASMYEQLGKILDSQGNPNPLNKVTTDDGKQLKVTPDQARMLRMLMTTDKVKPMVRTQFIKDVQQSSTLVDFLDHDYHELPSLFVKRYLS